MPQTMTVTAPNGKSLTITGDRVPTEAELKDIFAKAGVDASPAAPPPAREPVDPNTLGTVARHIWQQVNPTGVGQLLPFPKQFGGGGWDAPVTAVKSFHAGQEKVRQEAADAFAKGDYVTGIRKGADWLGSVLSLGATLGMDTASDEAKAGKYAASLGDTLGIAATGVAPQVSEAIRTSAPMRAVADAADRGAQARVVDVMAPKVGPNKPRFGGIAERVAPAVVKDLVQDGAPFSRDGLHQAMADKLSAAETALDDAASARNPNQVVHTAPVLRSLQTKRDALTAQTHRVDGLPAGEDVAPAPNAARIRQIDQAMDEVSRLGPVANYEALRRIRQAYDGPAKAVYAPAVTADYITAQGSKLGAADVTGVLRQTLADMDPSTAHANADYSLYRSVNDVLDATAEVERSRPTVGRSIMASGVGAITGEAAGAMFGQQGVGAAVGGVLGPLVERGVNTKVAPALKLQVARQLGVLADAIRSSQPTKVETTLRVLRPLIFSTTGLTEPVVPRPATARAETTPQ